MLKYSHNLYGSFNLDSKTKRTHHIIMKNTFLAIFSLLFLFIGCQNANKWGITVKKSGLVTDSAMVVSAHPLASEVGAVILKQGGNAVDAAIAVQFALAVVYPTAGNIGGGGFMVLRENNGEVATLDFREMAPKKAGRNMYLDSTDQVIENLSLRGHLAAGVPGSVAGMFEAFNTYGSLPWKDLLQPAIDLAINGFALTAREARLLNSNQEDFKKYNTVQPDNVINENDWKEGDMIIYKDLGHTLELIRDNGKKGFYEGETAKNIVAEMKRGNGIITMEDLKTYKAIWRTPLIGDYKEYKIIGMPPPSSGGVALLQLLESVESYPIGEWGFQTTQTIHLITEAERRVYADRATHLGDPDYWEIPVKELVDAVYNKERMASFTMDSATRSSLIYAGNPKIVESESTTHFSIVDKNGNAVSVTTTLNGGFGSKVFVAGSGFLLNNEMDDFSIKPGFPNYYGLVGGEANAIAPGKRMLSSMTPTIMEKDGQLKMVLGTPGGSTIITSVFQTILNVIEYDMSMQEAVNARRFHHQWKPDTLYIENNTIDTTVTNKLIDLGHYLVERGTIGKVDAILINDAGKLEGGSDSRGDDTAAGY